MIVLDTNVVSEIVKPRPDDNVATWLNEQSPETMFISSITVSELLFGVECLPPGKRQKELQDWIENRVLAKFTGRILPLDEDSAKRHATIRAQCRRSGKAICFPDSCIAAIADSNHMMIASRDTTAFNNAGVRTINPWNAHE